MADGIKAIKVIERLARRAGCALKLSPDDRVDDTINALEKWMDEQDASAEKRFKASWIADRTHNLMIDSRHEGFSTGCTTPLTLDEAKAKAEKDYEWMVEKLKEVKEESNA